MLHNLREKAGRFVLIFISVILIIVFIYSTDKTNQGSGAGQEIGSVNGERISLGEFQRSIEQRKELFRKMGFPEEQLKLMPMERDIFNNLVQSKLFVQFAEKKGFIPSHLEITDKIKELEFFKENGQFDLMKYKSLLKQNNITPPQFEKDVRNQLIAENWDSYLNGLAKVSDEEIQEEYIQLNDERLVRFVYITFEDAKKLFPITSSDVKKFLESEDNKKKVQEKFEALKALKYKDKKIEAVQDEIAQEVISQNNREKIQLKRKELAEKIAQELSMQASSISQINAWIKPMGLSVKTGFNVSRKSRNLPGVGDLPALTNDLFKDSSAIDLKGKGKAKIYETASGVLILGMESKKIAQIEKLDASQENSLRAQLTSQKRNVFRTDLLRYFQENSKVKENSAFLKKTNDQG